MNLKTVALAVVCSAAVGGFVTACSGTATTGASGAGTAPAVTASPQGSTAASAAPINAGTTEPSAPASVAPTQTAPAPATLPVLGTVWAPGVQGYGETRPTGLNNNGDPTGIVSHLRWSSWGHATATGTGTAEYVGPGQSVAQGTEERATVVAFDLGTCNGKPAYRAIEWYFPGQGQHFDPTRYFDACAGQDHGM